MNSFKCLVCNGEHFRKGYYEVDVDVEIYPNVVNDVSVKSLRSFDEIPIELDIEFESTIYNEIVERGDIFLKLASEYNKGNRRYDKIADVYRYACEECGYIMSFTNKKLSESKYEESTRKQKENTYDWSNFGK
ncbi:hypothetical protein ABER02_08155 [Rossellomorea marisflavi]|uniref:hypothetical protein n=1 Tax=Rossellomorea marisflavi TaxID=189381 RepID=UPI003D27B663